MARQNYGNLRGRRGGNGAWQWTVIGFVLGFGCAAIIGLVLVISSASGLVNLDGVFAANRPTQTPIVITNTPAPVTATLLPTEGLLPSQTPVSQVVVQAPTTTPTTDTSLIQVEPSVTPTTQVVATQALVSSAPTTPAQLSGLISPLRKIDGGAFQMGTTVQEVADAVNECVNTFKGNCDISMGQDSSPPHQITLDAYQMEETEVTYKQYLAFLNSMGANSHRTGCDGQLCLATRAEDEHSNVIFDTANYRVLDAILEFPVAGVTWYGADAYCQAIGRRLPTEAEWEHAARGVNNSIYPWDGAFDVLKARTNRPLEEDAQLRGAKAIRTYGSFANDLYDMAGNVSEWVYDWYSSNYYNQLLQGPQPIPPNPQGPPAGTEKVVRGGSWADNPFFARAVQRSSLVPSDHSLSIGFRCAANADTGTTGTTGNTTPLSAPTASTGGASGNEENTANSQPTLPPPPVLATSSSPLATLAPGG